MTNLHVKTKGIQVHLVQRSGSPHSRTACSCATRRMNENQNIQQQPTNRNETRVYYYNLIV